MENRRNRTAAVAIAGVALAAGAILVYSAQRNRPGHPPDSAPGRTARGKPRFGKYNVVGRTVTINKPRNELFAYWHDFANLPRFMANIEAVEPVGDGRFRWTILAPAGRRVMVETQVVEDRENELIAWRSTPRSDIDTEGRVAFRDAPADRGTEIEAIIAYKPPAGEIGRLIAKLFQREPSIQGRRDLKRFKMLMETGEIATSQNRRNHS